MTCTICRGTGRNCDAIPDRPRSYLIGYCSCDAGGRRRARHLDAAAKARDKEREARDHADSAAFAGGT